VLIMVDSGGSGSISSDGSGSGCWLWRCVLVLPAMLPATVRQRWWLGRVGGGK